MPRREGGREAGRETERERLSQIFMPLQAAAAAGKTSPRASAPLNPLAPLPAGRPAVKVRCPGPCRGRSPAAAAGPAAPGRQWAAAGPAGAVRPARSGRPPPLPGLRRRLPAGLPAGAGSARGVLGAAAARPRTAGARASFLGGESREGGGGRFVTRFPLLFFFFLNCW